VDVTQTARYQGNLQDNGRTLTCTAEQRDKAGILLYTATVDLRLDVTGAAVGAVLAVPIGGIIGIVLGILLLFLLCGFCAFFVLSGKARRKGGARAAGDRQWIVHGAGGRAGIIADDQVVDHSDYIEASKMESPTTVPVTHEVLVKESSSVEDKLNYDSNVSIGLFNWSKKSGSDSKEVDAEGLETILLMKNDSSSDSDSSSSGKAKKIRKVKNKVAVYIYFDPKTIMTPPPTILL
jgi:hypothetical protein